MNTVSTILYVIVMIVTFIFVLGIFIQTNKEMWKNFKEDHTPWFRNTRMGMNYFNRKNGIKVLTEREYCNIPKSDKIVYIDKED
jgi:hypothetical protein